MRLHKDGQDAEALAAVESIEKNAEAVLGASLNFLCVGAILTMQAGGESPPDARLRVLHVLHAYTQAFAHNGGPEGAR